MISEQDIKSFLEGNDPEQYIVAVEYDYISDSIYKIKEDPIKGKQIIKDSFAAFCWVGDLRGLNFYNDSKGQQKEGMSKHKIIIEKLRTTNEDGSTNERLETGLKYLVRSLKGYRSLVQFFRDGGLDPWGEAIKDKIIILSPVEQYLISKEKRLFKGFEEYNDITRLVFDLETTALEPKDGRIFMIGIKTNKGYKRVIECATPDEERKGIVEFFRIIDELKPTIIGGYNSANFDWYWIFERCKMLNIDIKRICKTLHSKETIKQRENLLKLANEVERYNQVGMWGYNVIDIIHSVRRTQAINSGIKSAGLKYITKYIDAEAKDRVYIDHLDIGPFYAKKEEYWLNIENGNYRKVGVDQKIDSACEKHPDKYIKTTGDNLVERYLDDDLEETLLVDEEFNQGTFLLATLVPTTYERISTMGTATIWKMIMLAWSFKHKLTIPKKQEKGPFVGGLSRLLKVGYSEEVLKLDYSSLYPSIQLVHNIFPDCDVTGVLKGMLSYFRNERITNKNLAAEWKSKDKKISLKYDRKQLPLKVFINSMFGALSAPQVFAWGDMKMGEQITATGRQYLRQMLKFFKKRGYNSLVCDTDGINFSLPEGGIDHIKYIGKGLNWLVKEGKEYVGYEAHVAEFNDLFMRGAMGLDADGCWKSCINLARKNYATMEYDGKIKLTGNTIKSKKLPIYIEEFLDKGVKQLLEGDGKSFVEWYYEYLTKIFNQEIPLMKIAQRAKVKLSIKDYKLRATQTTKSGGAMSRMAHMELVIKDKLNTSLGDVIFYVNNGVKASHGDVQKVNKPKAGWKDEHITAYGGPIPENLTSIVQLNCYRFDPSDIETNPDMTGEYNVPRAVATFNKRIEPLLIVFGQEVRENLLTTDPEERSFFTTEQCKLINGVPFKPEDQDTVEDLLTITQQELDFWNSVGINPNYIYELAEEGWEEFI